MVFRHSRVPRQPGLSERRHHTARRRPRPRAMTACQRRGADRSPIHSSSSAGASPASMSMFGRSRRGSHSLEGYSAVNRRSVFAARMCSAARSSSVPGAAIATGSCPAAIALASAGSDSESEAVRCGRNHAWTSRPSSSVTRRVSSAPSVPSPRTTVPSGKVTSIGGVGASALGAATEPRAAFQEGTEALWPLRADQSAGLDVQETVCAVAKTPPGPSST